MRGLCARPPALQLSYPEEFPSPALPTLALHCSLALQGDFPFTHLPALEAGGEPGIAALS